MATTFYNQATLSYNGISTTSNTVTGEILDALSVTKTSLTKTYSPDSVMTYVVSLINTGTSPLTSLTLTDNLGAYNYSTEETSVVVPLVFIEGTLLYYVDGVLQAAPTVGGTSPLTVTGINIPIGGNATLIYQAQTNEFAPPDGSITNTVSATGGGLVATVTATETVTATTQPVLSITKSVSPTSVSENGDLTYFFNIENVGSSPATETDNVTVTDTFSPVLRNLTVAFNGQTLSPETDYNYDETTGEFTTNPGVITVPAATFTQNPETGEWQIISGNAVLTVTGIV